MLSRRKKIIIVSNRLPITVKIMEGQIVYRQSGGGLVSGMGEIAKRKSLWVGWPGVSKESLTKSQMQEISSHLKSLNMIPVFLSELQIENYYEGYCNSVLWPLLHNKNIFSEDKFITKYKASYNKVNKLFAGVVSKVVGVRDTVWVQDYHLFLLPHLLRRDNIKSGFFLHTPLPDLQDKTLLYSIVKNLKAASLVGFQTLNDAKKYSNALKLPVEESNAGVFPIGIDYHGVKKISKSKILNSKAAIKTLLTVDRLDPCKSIPDRINAVSLLLDRHEDLIGKIKLRVLAVPSRETTPAYKDEKYNLEHLIRTINAKYETDNWSPIEYIYTSLEKKDLYKLYMNSDIGLICPPFDGMNLVAKEFVAVNGSSSKALILSSGMGSATQLKDAFIVEKYNVESIADTIYEAIVCDTRSLRKRMRIMSQNVRKEDSRNWSKRFLKKLSSL